MKRKGTLLGVLILSWILCFAVYSINVSMDYGIQMVTNEPEQALQTSMWDNYGNPICTQLDLQSDAAIAAVGNGSAIIVWTDTRIGTSDIYGQRISPLGNNQWKVDGIPIFNKTTKSEIQAAVCADLMGGTIVVCRSGPSPYDIYAQRVDSMGRIRWGAAGIAVCSEVGEKDYVGICSDGVGGAIIAWQDKRSGNWDIYAQRINITGHIQWAPNGTLICDAVGTQETLVITSDNDEGALIAWVDNRTGTRDIYVQRIKKAGNMQFIDDGTAICMAVENQYLPTITSDGVNGAIVTWTDLRKGSGLSDIYAARITGTGVKSWTNDGVAVCTGYTSEILPQICSANNSGAIIAWVDYRNMDPDIYAQLFNATGAAQWTANGTVICDVANDQKFPEICPDGRGGAFIAWEDYRSGSNWDIYVANINATGFLKWDDGTPKCTVTGDQEDVKVVKVLPGSAILTWVDARSGNNDIYAASISIITESGNIPGFDFTFILLGFFGLMAVIFMINRKKRF